MHKISMFYQEIKDLSERMYSLVQEGNSTKGNFMSILDSENEFQSNEIPRVSKKNQ